MSNSMKKQAKIGVVDNWHPQWAKVYRSAGDGPLRRLVQADGWLPARQNLLVAFVDERVAGHLCFRIEPEAAQGEGASRHHPIGAEVDSFSVEPGFDGSGIEEALRSAGIARARELNCRALRGFDLTANAGISTPPPAQAPL
jgi:hypothetical protein